MPKNLCYCHTCLPGIDAHSDLPLAQDPDCRLIQGPPRKKTKLEYIEKARTRKETIEKMEDQMDHAADLLIEKRKKIRALKKMVHEANALTTISSDASMATIKVLQSTVSMLKAKNDLYRQQLNK